VVSLKIVTEVASIKKNKPVLIVRHGIRAYWFLEKLRVQHINDSIIPVAGRSVKVWMHGIKNILARGGSHLSV